MLSAGLLGERINLFHSALRLHATEREHGATSERCLSKVARSCSYRAFLSCGFRSKQEGERKTEREKEKKSRLRGCSGKTVLTVQKASVASSGKLLRASVLACADDRTWLLLPSAGMNGLAAADWAAVWRGLLDQMNDRESVERAGERAANPD